MDLSFKYAQTQKEALETGVKTWDSAAFLKGFAKGVGYIHYRGLSKSESTRVVATALLRDGILKVDVGAGQTEITEDWKPEQIKVCVEGFACCL